MLAEAYTWITRRGFVLSIVLVVIWPLLSVPAGKFTKAYFAFWVLLAIAWGFGAAITITILPLVESSAEIGAVVYGIFGIKSSAPAEEYDEEDKFTEN